MQNETDKKKQQSAHAIAFGFDRATDEESLQFFLRRFAADKLLATLVPRLRDEEIAALVDSLTAVMRNHLTEKEYHRLFLAE